MKVWRKKTVIWKCDDKRVKAKSRGAVKHTLESKKYYGTLTLSDGKKKQVPLTEDEETSLVLLRRLQNENDHDKALGITPRDRERSRAIEELLTEYKNSLLSRENTSQHVEQQLNRIRALIEATNAKTLDDLNASRISNTLAKWRKTGKRNPQTKKKKKHSIATSNHYLRAIKGFSRWAWRERKTSHDLLSNLSLLNGRADIKRKRRAFTMQELSRLVEVTQKDGKCLKGNGWHLT